MQYNSFSDNSPLAACGLSALSVAVASILAAGAVRAQDQEQNPQQQADNGVVEEVVVMGRFLSAAESLTAERLEIPFSADFLGAEVISRAGDPDIASALRRVPGLTLIDGKFVYVRGLGERYSNVLVNGAAVPSPDLTRSVIPLDLFPTSIVESIKIQKSPSPDVPAAFGGGVIDVRTNSVPDGVVADFSFDLGMNGISDGDGLTFPMEATPLPAGIAEAIETYQGNIGVGNILGTLRQTDPLAPISEARAIHQGLIDSLNTNVGIEQASLDPDLGGKLTLGNSWDLNDNWRFGASIHGTYGEKYRNENQFREGIGNPETNTLDIRRTTYEERTASALNLGLDYGVDHLFEFGHYILDTDEAIASISRGFDQNNQFPDQIVGYDTRIEERELSVTQLSGTHSFTDTPGLTDFLEGGMLETLEFSWFYSESEASTDIPNQTRFQSSALLDADGSLASEQVLASTTSGQFAFLDLEDDQDSWGGTFTLPLALDAMELTTTAGWWASEKTRDYRQYNVNLNSVGVQSQFLSGTPGDVLSSGDMTVANGFDLSLGSDFGTESYVAAQKVSGAFGMLDMELDRWRFTVGARWEDYQQAVLPVDLLDFTGASILALQQQLADPGQRLAIREDDVYPSMAVTLNGGGWLGADDYQLRVSYGETVVRPDLREVADVVYIDPTLDLRVQGNPLLTSSPIDNFEIRSEFFYSGGDNFTVSLFMKDIQSPIEQIRAAGTDDDVVLGFANAESGEVAGIEFEGLKTLPRGLFLAGNITLSDSEIDLGGGLGTNLTNLERRLSGHSEWVVNATLGWDSENALHSAYLNFNAFGERIFFAGTDGNDDAYEQPFNLLGIVYKFFPTEQLEVEVQLDNILDEQREFEQVNASGGIARILTQDVGPTYSIGARWAF